MQQLRMDSAFTNAVRRLANIYRQSPEKAEISPHLCQRRGVDDIEHPAAKRQIALARQSTGKPKMGAGACFSSIDWRWTPAVYGLLTGFRRISGRPGQRSQADTLMPDLAQPETRTTRAGYIRTTSTGQSSVSAYQQPARAVELAIFRAWLIDCKTIRSTANRLRKAGKGEAEAMLRRNRLPRVLTSRWLTGRSSVITPPPRCIRNVLTR